jgi:hypothetical protein
MGTQVATLTRIQYALILLLPSCRCRRSLVHGESTPKHRHLPRREIVDHRVFFSHNGYQCNLFGWVDPRVSLYPTLPHIFLRVPGAIVWRLFLARNASTRGASLLWPVIFAFIESSALYALAILSASISYLNDSHWVNPSVNTIISLVVSPDVLSASFLP